MIFENLGLKKKLKRIFKETIGHEEDDDDSMSESGDSNTKKSKAHNNQDFDMLSQGTNSVF